MTRVWAIEIQGNTMRVLYDIPDDGNGYYWPHDCGVVEYEVEVSPMTCNGPQYQYLRRIPRPGENGWHARAADDACREISPASSVPQGVWARVSHPGAAMSYQDGIRRDDTVRFASRCEESRQWEPMPVG